jgi:hypothetical protein
LGQKKNDPHQRLELLESASGWGTLIILSGIILEIWMFFAFDPHDPKECGWTLTANALIALGLIIEYVAIRMTIVAAGEAKIESDEKIAASEARAAEALERTTMAQLELARFRTPRSKFFREGSAASLITNAVRPFSGTRFDSGLSANSGEQADFWWDLQPALVEAGWVHIPWGQEKPENEWGHGGLGIVQGDRPLSASVAASDIEIHLRPAERAALLPAATALISALNEIGIAAAEVPYNVSLQTPNAIHIAIGDKR